MNPNGTLGAAAAELLKNMDPTVDPCDDFYAFACGGFEKKTVIPDDQSSVTTFSQISDRVTEQLRQLIERPLADDEEPHNRLVKNLYASCLNKSEPLPRPASDPPGAPIGLPDWGSVFAVFQDIRWA